MSIGLQDLNLVSCLLKSVGLNTWNPALGVYCRYYIRTMTMMMQLCSPCLSQYETRQAQYYRGLNNSNRVLGVPYYYSIVYPQTLLELLRPHRVLGVPYYYYSIVISPNPIRIIEASIFG